MKKIKDQGLLDRIRLAIENVETAETMTEISNLKKMSGTGNFYRIRFGDFRMGIIVEGDTVVFVRCLPRKDLYRFFP